MQPIARRQSTAHGFFAVMRGRVRGVFYRWCDAKASVAGFAGAKLKGFDSEDEARSALANG